MTTAASTRSSEIAYDKGATAPLQTMEPGEQGLHVRRLQESMVRLRYLEGSVTGTYGPATRKAVAAFQREHALEVTGSYDARTRKALRTLLETKMPKEGPRLSMHVRGAAVEKLERQLKRRGLLEGRVDDRFDARTAEAVKRLEKKIGAKVNGIVGAKVWRALGGAGAGSGADLRRGAEGPAVKQLQARLIQLGHLAKGGADGIFGAVTARAVRSFEKAQGLTVDGQVTQRDWKALGVHQLVRDRYGGPELKKGQRGAAVRLLERALAKRGLLAGKVDHVFDARTEAAVKRLEARLGMRTDGVVGNRLWTRLGGAGRGSGPRLSEGSSNTAAVKVLQRRLARLGHYSAPVDGDFGPVTARAVNALKRQHGLEADGEVGPSVWRALGRHVVANPTPKASGASEPAHDYRRVREDEGWINVRTQIMLRRAEAYARKLGVEKPFYIVQGSYTSGVAASAGTHDGGGALDVRTWDRSREDVSKMVKALRMAGFAAWKRGYGDDSMEAHIHAIAIGDRELAGDARSQVVEYFRGGDGLVGSAGDGDSEVGRPWPKWANKYR